MKGARRACLCGVGIDVVDLDRASRFVSKNGEGLRRFFLKREYACFRASRSPVRAFALFFAAKEAVSKALGVPVIHPYQFRKFPVDYSRGKLRGRIPDIAGIRGRVARLILSPFAIPGRVGVMAFAYR